MGGAEDRNIDMARRIAAAVQTAGGRVYYVGGFVRDRLMGLENKDVDIEVHGVTVATLEGLLDALGERTAMGASFGVMGLRHYQLDIAMPRSERATGRGHRDFEVFVDPFIGPERAAMRRDFTMNALMQDVLTGEILDFFGGRADLAAGRIRHVSDASFAEDPLRVFRAAQFAARFEFEVAGETLALCARMDVAALACERVMGELEKALMKARRPARFFEALRRMDQLKLWFAELSALPEERWRQVMERLDGAAALRARARAPLPFMLLSLCAFLEAGEAEALLTRLTNARQATQYVLSLRGVLPRARALLGRWAEADEWMAVLDAACCPEDLILLLATPGTEAPLDDLLALYRQRMAQPFVMGRDLVAAGVRPGPRMGVALAYAHKLRLAGRPREEQLRRTLAAFAGEEDGT